MSIPVRCFTCGKPIGHLFEEFQDKVTKSPEEARNAARKKFLDDKKLDRYCCRAALMTHIELEDVAQFRKF
ncbi:DNA-directed RNA polymerase subunit N [Candidatus Woesearchaeota archaeon]|nr:DNA-directed RNA polymerase subunit N [Candidatus Woesearchaeota archaeon]